MRILYVVTAAQFGGAVVHVLQLMEHMVKQGHSVGVVAAPNPRLMKKAKKLCVRLFPNPHFVRPVRPGEDMRALWPVFRTVRKFNPDLVSAHSTKAGFAARLACAILHKPVIFTAHGWPFTEGRSVWKRKFLALAEQLAARATMKIICVSKHDRDLALQFRIAPNDKLVVIHNGMDPKPFLGADGSQVRQKLRLDDTLLLTMVGRLVHQKDPFTLFEACRILRGQFKVLLVGGGDLRTKVERFIHKSGLKHTVILAGERSDVPEILAASDIFVLSTNWEGLPRSIIEAMMAGLPVVATRVGGVPELVEDGVTGLLVPPKDPDALAEALQKLIADPELRRRMGEAGREKALKEFTLDRMLRETEKVYEGVLENTGTENFTSEK